MTLEPLDDTGRWWRINGREVDLNTTENIYPYRAAVLAHRDGTDEEGRNIAALLATAIDTGIDLDGPTHLAVTGWLFAQSQRIVARLRTKLADLEGDHRERAA